jgi:hypothetical protein
MPNLTSLKDLSGFYPPRITPLLINFTNKKTDIEYCPKTSIQYPVINHQYELSTRISKKY